MALFGRSNEDEKDSSDTMNQQQQDARERYMQQQKTIEKRARDIKHIIMVISGKGGVGKSTVAANLARALARQGEAVGLLDADLHGPNAAVMTGTDRERLQAHGEQIVPATGPDGMKVISIAMMLPERDSPTIWRGPLRGNMLRQFLADVEWGTLDYLIVDLPPGTGDEALTIAQALPEGDGAIVVTTPQQVSQDDCRKAINFVHKVELPVIGVVENMSGFVCPHCGEKTAIFSEGGGEAMAQQMDVAYLGSLPLVPDVVARSDQGKSVVDDDAPEAIRTAFETVVAAVKKGIGDR
ncbi:MAG: Mrp/NBP35 family ATP-binding protein [Armatimonadota bacterium]